MKNLGAPKFSAGAPKKNKLGAPVQPMQNVSLEPCYGLYASPSTRSNNPPYDAMVYNHCIHIILP